jgi:hypothetical protein
MRRHGIVGPVFGPALPGSFITIKNAGKNEHDQNAWHSALSATAGGQFAGLCRRAVYKQRYRRLAGLLAESDTRRLQFTLPVLLAAPVKTILAISTW